MRGFTLAELLVTVTIMLIMTGVVFFNYNKFNESSLMTQVAYDMSLTIRQAQVYGLATKEGSGTSLSQPITLANADSSIFKHVYGVHFDKTSNNNKSFIFYEDIPGSSYNDRVYDDGHDIKLQTYFFQREIKIYELCYVPIKNGSPGNSCTVGGEVGSKGDTLDITFLRPNPEALILPDKTPYTSFLKVVEYGTIFLQNKDGTIKKKVVVYNTGQISVQSVL